MVKIALSAEFQASSWNFWTLKTISRTLENGHSICHQSIPPLSAGRVFRAENTVGVYFFPSELLAGFLALLRTVDFDRKHTTFVASSSSSLRWSEGCASSADELATPS